MQVAPNVTFAENKSNEVNDYERSQVYQLVDIEDPTIFYIGSTINRQHDLANTKASSKMTKNILLLYTER